VPGAGGRTLEAVSTVASELFSVTGPLAGSLGVSFEARPQQREMARAVAQALEARGTLLVEAGTGVGKSFAYLAPAMERIIASGGRERVVIATNTIALQEQIVTKDIPALFKVIPGAEEGIIRAELVKGRGNYLSIRRLQMASKKQDRLFADPAARRSLHAIEEWAYGTSDGTLSTLPQLERPGVWDRAQSDAGNCMGRKCPTYDKCFYQAARRRMERANLLVCNHALFFSDLSMRRRDTGFLPKYEHVILDEAHHVEDVASDHFGLSLSEGRVRHVLSSLSQRGKRRGFLLSIPSSAAGDPIIRRCLELVDGGESAGDAFFEGLTARTGGLVGTVRLGEGEVIENGLTPALRELAMCLRRLREHLSRDEDKYELNAYALRVSSLADEAEMLVNRQLEGCAYWIETTAGETSGPRVTLACSPIDVGPILAANLFREGLSVVLTSATLAVGGEGGSSSRAGFEHTLSRLGCDGARTLALGSPFDHAAQVTLHVDASMPDPRDPRYNGLLAERIIEHIRATGGGAFVLFTSFATLRALADSLGPRISELGMPLLAQGRDGSRSAILERFKANDRSVLLGTSSFWQGVDVPGRALRNVIITRLPFDPPDRPLTQARLEMIEARGGNPFMEDSLPRAVIRFKQGFGRLIRTAGDTGRVVVLDSRLVRARYARAFFRALPPGVRVLREDGSEHLGAAPSREDA